MSWNRAFLEKLIVTQDNQEIPQLLRDTMIHYRVQQSMPLVPNLIQTNPVHKVTILILPSTLFPPSFLSLPGF